MSVIVKGMEMPRMCAECDFMGGLLMDEGIYTCDCPVDTICGTNISNEIEKDCRHPDCPLGELPEKHGDLIDRNALLRDIEHYHLSDGKFQHWVEIQNAIVEAEGEE